MSFTSRVLAATLVAGGGWSCGVDHVPRDAGAPDAPRWYVGSGPDATPADHGRDDLDADRPPREDAGPPATDDTGLPAPQPDAHDAGRAQPPAPVCGRYSDCPRRMPCLLDLGVCGCRGDAHCESLGAGLVCDEDGRCIDACGSHDDCRGDEACMTGRCVEGACRDDAMEAAEAGPRGAVLPLDDLGEGLAHGRFELRLCADFELGAPWVDLSDTFFVEVDEGDELTLDVRWPRLDDEAGPCGEALDDLHATLWAPDGAGWAMESQPGGLVDPEDGACLLRLQTRAPSRQEGRYRLRVDAGLHAVDYVLEVWRRGTPACGDGGADHDSGAVASFDCEEFLIAGGSHARPDTSFGVDLCAGDVHERAVHLRPGDALRAVLGYDPRLGELRARLFAPPELGFDVPLEDVVGVSGVAVLVESGEDVVVEGDYVLRIDGAFPAHLGVGVATTYTLSLSCTSLEVPCVPDPGEPDDGPATAGCLLGGQGGACPGPVPGRVDFEWPADAADAARRLLCERGRGDLGRDEDWLRVEVGEGATVSVEADNDQGPAGDRTIELALGVLDGPDFVPEHRSAAAGPHNALMARDMPGGTWYLRVRHPVRAVAHTVPYRLSGYVQGAPPPCEDDDGEPDDWIEDATPLGVAAAPGEWACLPADPDGDARMLCNGDDDWFALDLDRLPAVAAVEVQVRCQDPDAGDVDVDLRDADGNLACPPGQLFDGVCQDQHLGCGREGDPLIRLRREGPPAGEPLYVRIHGIDDATNGYRLCARVEPEACAEDAAAGNHRFADAAPIAADVPQALVARICPGTDDWWRFDLPGPLPAATAVRFLHDDDADLDVALVAEDAHLADIDTGLARQACLTGGGPLQAGAWFVHVWGADAGSEAAYELTVRTGERAAALCRP